MREKRSKNLLSLGPRDSVSGIQRAYRVVPEFSIAPLRRDFPARILLGYLPNDVRRTGTGPTLGVCLRHRPPSARARRPHDSLRRLKEDRAPRASPRSCGATAPSQAPVLRTRRPCTSRGTQSPSSPRSVGMFGVTWATLLAWQRRMVARPWTYPPLVSSGRDLPLPLSQELVPGEVLDVAAMLPPELWHLWKTPTPRLTAEGSAIAPRPVAARGAGQGRQRGRRAAPRSSSTTRVRF